MNKDLIKRKISKKVDVPCMNPDCNRDCLIVPSAYKINEDGDYVCSQECEKKYQDHQKEFFGVVIFDEKKLTNYFGVSVESERKEREKDKKEAEERLGPYKSRNLRKKRRRLF